MPTPENPRYTTKELVEIAIIDQRLERFRRSRQAFNKRDGLKENTMATSQQIADAAEALLLRPRPNNHEAIPEPEYRPISKPRDDLSNAELEKLIEFKDEVDNGKVSEFDLSVSSKNREPQEIVKGLHAQLHKKVIKDESLGFFYSVPPWNISYTPDYSDTNLRLKCLDNEEMTVVATTFGVQKAGDMEFFHPQAEFTIDSRGKFTYVALEKNSLTIEVRKRPDLSETFDPLVSSVWNEQEQDAFNRFQDLVKPYLSAGRTQHSSVLPRDF